MPGVGHLPGWDYFFQTFLPFGHGVSPPGEVWDACAACSKAGPVMGLRPPICCQTPLCGFGPPASAMPPGGKARISFADGSAKPRPAHDFRSCYYVTTPAPLASPPKHPKRKFSDFLERRGLAARAAGASFPRCAQSGDLPPRRVNAIARFRFGHNPLQPNIQTMFYALKHVQWIKLLRTKIKTHRQVHSRIPVDMIRSRLHVAFPKYRRQIQGKDGLGKCDRLALAPD